MSYGFAVTDELSKLKQTNNGANNMNILYKILYNYLRKKVEQDETVFRNNRLKQRLLLNNGYTKAGH